MVDELHPTFYVEELEAHAASVAGYLKAAPAGLPIHGAVPAILPQVVSRSTLASYLSPLQGRVDGLSFYNYGFMAPEALSWIKDATTDFVWA